MEHAEAGLLRCLAFFEAIEYAPTQIELIAHWDVGLGGFALPSSGDAEAALRRLLESGLIEARRGRITPQGRVDLVAEHERREGFFPRKIRRARRVARWIARCSGVRFVALCNTTAFAHAEDGSDLDFFVIAKRGTLWQTRALATAPFLRQRPQQGRALRDAICLSFFVDDSALDLSPLQMEDDVYFRHWFLSLLPLYNDGVSAALWRANASITERHPFALPWIVNDDLKISIAQKFRTPNNQYFESFAQRLQRRKLPSAIRSIMNRDTRVVLNDHVLKFHVEDGREKFRTLYRTNCLKYGIDF